VVCGWQCAIELSNKKKEKEIKKWQKEKREELMTASDWRNKLQKVFNEFIRERDRGLPCASCERQLGKKYDAGHLYSVGRFPELRFSELNCHAQCVNCNRHLHGNGAMYRKNIVKRIGEDGLKALDSQINIMKHYSIPELKEMIIDYRQKIKLIKMEE
jgi:hypothetical protein